MARTLAKDSAAESDLIGIWLYSFETWSETQADRYLDSLEDGVQRILEEPRIGKQRNTVREGYWSMRIQRHVVFYTFTDSEVRIRRVLHEVMDPDLHL